MLDDLSTEGLHELSDHLVETDYTLMEDLIVFREQRMLSVDTVAARMGTTPDSVKRFETYDYNPTLSELRRYALAVGVKITHTAELAEGDAW